ncbi:MAG: HD family hydrolase [Parvularculaceae bacterium]
MTGRQAKPKKTAAKPAEPPRAWQRMLSGRRLDLLDPSPIDVEIEDIAHGLARVARWNGQTIGPIPFNVAQHSVIVEQFCGEMKPGWPSKWRLAALLHDAPEFVIGDMISPFKAQLGGQYKVIESRLMQAIHLRFGLPAHLPEAVEKLIKRADRACAYFEAVQLAGFDVAEARKFFGAPKDVTPLTIKAMTTLDAQKAYLKRFSELSKAVAAESSDHNR